jgi:HSP20 family protein
MSVIRYNPFFTEFPFKAFEDSLSRMLQQDAPAAVRPWTPAVDILETENELVVKADLPDVTEKDIDIRIEDGTLSLKGERKFENQKKDDRSGYHRIERSYGAFARYFSLPDSVDPEKVKAEYKNGVLTVTLGKKEIAKPKQIKVAIQ